MLSRNQSLRREAPVVSRGRTDYENATGEPSNMKKELKKMIAHIKTLFEKLDLELIVVELGAWAAFQGDRLHRDDRDRVLLAAEPRIIKRSRRLK